MKLTFQLPHPTKEVTPNQRARNPFLFRNAKRQMRLLARSESARVRGDHKIEPPLWLKAKYNAVYYHKHPQHPDPDNLTASLKGYIDGLADDGIIKNDRFLRQESLRFERTDRLPRIEMTVEPE